MIRSRALKLCGYFLLGIHVFFLLDVFFFHFISSSKKVLTQNEGHSQSDSQKLSVSVGHKIRKTGAAGEKAHQVILDELNKDYAEQTDPKLITVIKEDWIDPPWDGAARHVSRKYPSNKETDVLKKLLKKEKGFFFEYIAGLQSFTLYLEQEKKWTGLLVEPDSKAYSLLQKRKRKAYTANACLCIKPFPTWEQLELTSYGNNTKARKFTRNIECQFFPLLSLLLAVKHTDVDFLSLRVSELGDNDVLNLLKAIRFDNINIEVISTTISLQTEAKNVLEYYLENIGFKLITEISDNSIENTLIFSKNRDEGL
ncbi:uncharacterized protein LOC106178802 [Lingula anatina]|uniref:Uncharacterized protein LOC106178802 n=1 Tax=Lingula anatina TaxID=7574 RepID=A0A1S3K5S9_LINAN|nr:uncharacterized protein LOC106178802 [Lingula anatina]|eukprot:XP_013417606.1 uncharacterized protein LOC106178802 [Lingula anatina]